MRRLLAVVGASALLALLGGPSSGSPAAVRMSVLPTNASSTPRQFPVFAADGDPLGQATYLVTPVGGNCCESYVAATRTGMLVELGGHIPYFSTDGGASWKLVRPTVPLPSGEGAISAAPNGDIVGVTWDPYSGDRLVAYKYTAATDVWEQHENPLHAPFFDRPWISVVKGPFSDGVRTVPYVTVVRGGFGIGKELELVSLDGLVYAEPSTAVLGGPASGHRAGPLSLGTDPDTDFFQPHPESLVTPLPGSGAIRRQQAGLTCASLLQYFETDRRWSCLGMSGLSAGVLRADGNGRLHQVRFQVAGPGTITYRVSSNGGATWQSTTYALPGPAPSIFMGTGPDVKVDSARKLTYVAFRASGTGTAGQQDMVVRFDHTGGVPVVKDVFHVGLGDLVAGSGLTTTGPRMDFASIALLPDGRFAVAYDDSTTVTSGGQPQPWLAVLQ